MSVESENKTMLDEIVRRMRITKEVRIRMKNRMKKESAIWESFLISFTLLTASISLLFLVFGSVFSENQKQIAGLYGILTAVYMVVVGYEYKQSNCQKHLILLALSTSELNQIIQEARSPRGQLEEDFVSRTAERYGRSLERFHIDQDDKDFHYALMHNEELKSKTRHSAFIDANRSAFESEYKRSHIYLLFKLAIVPVLLTVSFAAALYYAR